MAPVLGTISCPVFKSTSAYLEVREDKLDGVDLELWIINKFKTINIFQIDFIT